MPGQHPQGISPFPTHHRFTRNGCSNPCMICSSRNTFRTSSLSTHFCLFMYFIAYIFFVSRFCTMHTCKAARGNSCQNKWRERKRRRRNCKPSLAFWSMSGFHPSQTPASKAAWLSLSASTREALDQTWHLNVNSES